MTDIKGNLKIHSLDGLLHLLNATSFFDGLSRLSNDNRVTIIEENGRTSFHFHADSNDIKLQGILKSFSKYADGVITEHGEMDDKRISLENGIATTVKPYVLWPDENMVPALAQICADNEITPTEIEVEYESIVKDSDFDQVMEDIHIPEEERAETKELAKKIYSEDISRDIEECVNQAYQDLEVDKEY